MGSKFNELNNLDDIENDLNFDDEIQNDAYDYDYDYSEYDDYEEYGNEDYDDYFTTSSYERLEEDNYDEDDRDEEENEKPNNFRNIIIKVVLLILVVLLLIWGVSLFLGMSKKNSDKKDNVTVIKNDEINIEETFTKIKGAALKYYQEDNINDEEKKTVSINKLKKSGLIEKISSTYDLDKSNIILTKDNDNYILKIILVYDDTEKSRTYKLNNYSYCVDTYLCEEQDSTNIDITDTSASEENDSEKEYLYEYIKNDKILSNWTSWTEYEKTDCNTQGVVCSSNDSNCLTEVKLYQRKEKVGTYNKVYESSRYAFQTNETENIKVCSKYDYVKINNVYYKMTKNSNYKVLGAIKKDTQSDYYNWKYNGRASYSTPPSDSITTRYVFVGPDYTNCTNTCNNNLKYYYDSYTFTKTLTKTNNPSKDCSSSSTKVVANYSITSQKIAFSREELYGTVCYKSYRTRSVSDNKLTEWSYYNDEKLLNSGYEYTGNKKEK